MKAIFKNEGWQQEGMLFALQRISNLSIYEGVKKRKPFRAFFRGNDQPDIVRVDWSRETFNDESFDREWRSFAINSAQSVANENSVASFCSGGKTRLAVRPVEIDSVPAPLMKVLIN